MKTKQKIELELNIPEGFEISGINPIFSSTVSGDMAITGIVSLKPIEPPLELETNRFVCIQDSSRIINVYLHSNNQRMGSAINSFNKPAEARDLAKILNYWAENNRLPERVVVKEAK